VDYSNASYQASVWQSVFSPKDYFYDFFQGGVVYFLYLFYKICFFLKIHMNYSLNNDDFIFQTQMLALNIPFDVKILVRVLLIYALPFLVGWGFRKKVTAKIKTQQIHI
jgi:hypothetical protein